MNDDPTPTPGSKQSNVGARLHTILTILLLLAATVGWTLAVTQTPAAAPQPEPDASPTVNIDPDTPAPAPSDAGGDTQGEAAPSTPAAPSDGGAATAPTDAETPSSWAGVLTGTGPLYLGDTGIPVDKATVTVTCTGQDVTLTGADGASLTVSRPEAYPANAPVTTYRGIDGSSTVWEPDDAVQHTTSFTADDVSGSALYWEDDTTLNGGGAIRGQGGVDVEVSGVSCALPVPSDGGAE